MGSVNEYSLQNKELNYISKGFLWGLWNLLPIAGTIIMIIKILNRIFRSTSSKVLMFIALIIPYVNIASAIVFYVLVFKRIGGKFLIGVLLLPVLVGISTAISIPLYKGYVARAVARARVTDATFIMRRIINSQRVTLCATRNYYSIPLVDGATDIAALWAKGVDITDTKFFTYETVATGTKPHHGFTITATTTDDFGAAGGWITYTWEPSARPHNIWAVDGEIILPDMLPPLGPPPHGSLRY